MKLKHQLEKIPDLETRFDVISKKIYSVDASIFEVEPLGVAIPKTVNALQECVKACFSHRIPLIPRGAATGITGGCIGKGIIIDTSKHLNEILEIDLEKEFVICEPGVVQDDLNQALLPYGFRLGPDTSTGNRATIGGMIANDSAGAYSLKFGNMGKHILELDLILVNGEKIKIAQLDEEDFQAKTLLNNREGAIYRAVEQLHAEYTQEILNTFPQLPRRVSGYNLDKILTFPLNLCPLIAGSEGTLGIISQVKLKIVPIIDHSSTYLLQFDDLFKALELVPKILKFSPLAVELIDKQILDLGKQSPTIQNKLGWLNGDPEALLVVAFEEPQENFSSYGQLLEDKQTLQHVWDVRKAGLEILLSKRSYTRAVAFIEDIAVPPENVSPFLREFKAILHSVDRDAGIYGHVGAGCLHVRPFINLKTEQSLLHSMMSDVATLVKKYGGAMSGEHGDGLIRSWTHKKMFGSKICKAFSLIKKGFDPEGLMNPNKIVTIANEDNFLVHLREQPKEEFQTFLDFSAEGGFSLAVDMCNGNGLCRKKEGTMCPSFQATQDEYATTRARAQVLRSLVNGKLTPSDVTDKGILEILDLCLECKGCKKECPSQVDMAKMKAEMLYHHQEKHGYSLRSKLFAYAPTLYRVASPFASLFNYFATTRAAKVLLSRLGISPERTLPLLSTETFSSLFSKRNKVEGPKVVLFNDTFNEYQCPQVGTAALNVLNKMGFDVVVPPWTCCGQPLISKGFLKEAKKKAEDLVDILYPFAQNGLPIVGLEPSCILSLQDDYYSLLGHEHEKLKTVAQACCTFDEFVFNNREKLSFQDQPRHILLHGHCHQKALKGNGTILQLLRLIPQSNVEEISSGCCGMAGSFGYEKEHYELSMKIAELKLLPAIRRADKNALVVASGFSCRNQIPTKSYHIAEILDTVLK